MRELQREGRKRRARERGGWKQFGEQSLRRCVGVLLNNPTPLFVYVVGLFVCARLCLCVPVQFGLPYALPKPRPGSDSVILLLALKLGTKTSAV